MNTQKLTRGQLERTLSQRVQSLYRTFLGHQPSKVSCQLFDEKLTIVIENSVTQLEHLLVEEGNRHLAVQVREDLNQLIEPRIRELIESVVETEVLDLLSDATLETGRTGMIAILQEPPDTRPSSSRRISSPRPGTISA
ncbi:DUF2294 domain-containing protein [Leptolyngbya ohadii]|uniref:DUF2294 domain-containing protein n=1 Tax=Leptolyngbya ohadii TaxID=1962290 RepID=UPI000B5989DD|nr:DUF2294 domain-containing protein [Leptolyngbya ohadii]